MLVSLFILIFTDLCGYLDLRKKKRYFFAAFDIKLR